MSLFFFALLNDLHFLLHCIACNKSCVSDKVCILNMIMFFVPVTAGCPTVLECIRFQGRQRTINIPQEIGSNYYYFGLYLLDDPNGTRVHNLELEYQQNAERINTEILREWATGRGKKPVTWKTLTEVLCNIGLVALAGNIEVMKSTSTIL